MDVSDQDGTAGDQNVAGEPDEMVDSDVEESTDESEPEGEGARRELSDGGRTQHRWMPELRLIHANDPEAYSFATPQYSAHKLPRDVVDAGNGGPGAMQEFAKRWKGVVEREEESSDEEDSSADEADSSADEAGENVGPVVAAVA